MSDIVADARQVVTTGGGPFDEMWDGAPHDLVLLLCDEIEELRRRNVKLAAQLGHQARENGKQHDALWRIKDAEIETLRDGAQQVINAWDHYRDNIVANELVAFIEQLRKRLT